jgi:uncharacterized repeat protein (TIGR02543 family)
VGAFTYPIGDVVQLVAVPNPGYRFSGWTGDTSTVADASAASTTVTMAHNIALTAGFALAAPPVTTADIDLVVGLNLVTLPLTPATPFTAVSLIADVALQGGTVTQLDVWDETTGMWQSYKPGTGTLDFPLQLGRGAFLKVTVGTTWRVTGTALTSGVTLNLVTGLNLVGIPYSTTLLTASSLLAGIAAQGGNVTQLDMWDESTGMWKSYKPGTGTSDFDIVNWRGYFLKSTATSTYTP